MEHRLLDRITLSVAVAGVVLASLAWLLAGATVGLGAAVGAGVALANWLVLRWVMGRLMRGTTRSRSGLMVLLALKMGALMAVCWVLVAVLGVDPVGFAIGMGALVFGVVAGAALAGGDRGVAEEEG